MITEEKLVEFLETLIGKTFPYTTLLNYKHGRAVEITFDSVKISTDKLFIHVNNHITFEDTYASPVNSYTISVDYSEKFPSENAVMDYLI